MKKLKLNPTALRSELCSKFTKFIQQQGNEPNYANCQVIFNDSQEKCEVTIKLSCDATPDEDDNIFYYCNGINDLCTLTVNNNGEDFRIIDIFGFE